MRWKYCLSLFLEKHCMARGLQSKTIAAYKDSLNIFYGFVKDQFNSKAPEEIKTKDMLDYVDYLRNTRNNQNAAVNRNITIIRCFYKALVAMDAVESRENPMKGFPTLKAPKRKFKDTLNQEEVKDLINTPATNTIIGLRDRAILTLLYGTGIRSSECSGLKECDILLDERLVKVIGKGGSERILPLNEDVAKALMQYKTARGVVSASSPFFKSRKNNGLSRNSIYERVRKHTRVAKIRKKVTPHTLRHTFATHLIKQGENLVVVRDLLGHKQISSTQVYLHMTAADIREAVDRHPIKKLINSIKDFLPDLPFQYPPGTRFSFHS